jgi:F420-dependent oxidoreductase-like protein
MRFGLALPHYDFSLPDGRPISFARMAPYARMAERLEFDSVWISDHFFLSRARYGGPADPSGSLEPLTTLAGLAATTERVRLGTLVLAAPFRHPAVLAKTATAVDLLSGGRFDLGIGAGWYEDEFRAFGYGFGTVGERFSVLEETLQVLGLLLPGGPATFQGKHFRLEEAFNHPSPVQRPRPPIWLGAKGGDRSLRLAARYADGWNTVWRWTPEAYAERVRRAREACDREGRDPQTLRLSLGLYTVVGEDRDDLVARFRALQRWMPGGSLDRESLESFAKDTLTGTPERVLERLAGFAELGVEEVIVVPAPTPFAMPDPSIVEAFAEAVMPKAREL